MTNTQIEYLKLLGYKSTQEDGAILEHPRIHGYEGFVWKRDKFKDVLESFEKSYKEGYLKRVAISVINEI